MDSKLLTVIGVGGLPATGKSSLILSAVRQVGGWGLFRSFAIGPVRGYMAPSLQLMLLGVYDQRGFPGTDRLSMSVQEPIIDLIHGLVGNSSLNVQRVLFEGDRLFNLSFVQQVHSNPRIEMKMFVLTADDVALNGRRARRFSAQDESWITGRQTKLRRLAEAFPEVFETLVNNTAEDADRNVAVLMRCLNVG